MHRLFSKFLVIGASNFAFTLVVFTSLLEVFKTGYITALIASWLLGNVASYMLNFVWVFQPESRLNFKGRFVRYMLAGSVSIGLNIVVLSVLVEIGGYDPFWSQVILIPFIVGFNFSTANWWSLKHKGPSQ